MALSSTLQIIGFTHHAGITVSPKHLDYLLQMTLAIRIKYTDSAKIHQHERFQHKRNLWKSETLQRFKLSLTEESLM